MTIHVNSEIGRLQRVIIHTPGPEVDAMSPDTMQASLYDDIFYRLRATEEHRQLAATLGQFADVLTVERLVAETLEIAEARRAVLQGLTTLYGCEHLLPTLDEMPSDRLATQLIVGTKLDPSPSTVAGRLDRHAYIMPPMHNLFFTRDAAMCINDHVIIGAMAKAERRGEALLMRLLFTHHPLLRNAGFFLDGTAPHPPSVSVEGGDVFPLREDLVLIGCGERTSAAAIDYLIDRFAESERIRHVVVQPMPLNRAYIHLDLAFTMIDHGLCMIHEPVITGPYRHRPLVVTLDGDQRLVRDYDNLLEALNAVDLPLETVITGGEDPLWQAREQWHKGTNFFAMAPGKIISYGRNERTAEQLSAHGFALVSGNDVAEGRVDLTAPGRVAVMMSGAELARGGGGCRCMTLPVLRA